MPLTAEIATLYAEVALRPDGRAETRHGGRDVQTGVARTTDGQYAMSVTHSVAEQCRCKIDLMGDVATVSRPTGTSEYLAEEIVGTRNSRRVLVERTRLEQEGSREERRIQYVFDFHSSYDLIGLVSQLDAEYDGSGFGVGAQVHAAQRRRGAFARYVGVESVVFLPQIECFRPIRSA